MMLTADGPRALEFNCRLGDPETQALLPLLETDLLEVLLACTEGRLGQLDVRWKAQACAAVVASAPGYPGSYARGLPITGLDAAAADDVFVFHAGTGREAGQLVTTGGRVLAVSALGDSLEAALRRAYQALDGIHFDGIHYRRDIGHARTD
jgi:phosphoribosylamine--glycine ligase